MTQNEERTVFRSRDGRVEISTNIPGFKWPSREEKIAGLLSVGLIDEIEAERLRKNAGVANGSE